MKELAEYKACLYWFDQTILSQIPSDRKIIHLWSFGHDKQDSKLSGKYHPNNLTYLHNWKHGCEIRPSCMSIARKRSPDKVHSLGGQFMVVKLFERFFCFKLLPLWARLCLKNY